MKKNLYIRKTGEYSFLRQSISKKGEYSLFNDKVTKILKCPTFRKNTPVIYALANVSSRKKFIAVDRHYAIKFKK